MLLQMAKLMYTHTPHKHSVLESKAITLLTKVHLVKAMVFPVVMYRCESWTIKKAECWRIDAFELLGWKGILRIPWTARSNLSILRKSVLNILWKDWCWSSNALTTWYKPSWLTGKDPAVKKDWRQKNDRWDGWMASSIQWTWIWVNSKRWWGTGKPGMPQCMGSQRVRHDLVTEQQHTLS